MRKTGKVRKFFPHFAKTPGITTDVKIYIELLLQISPTELLPVINADKSDKRHKKVLKKKERMLNQNNFQTFFLTQKTYTEEHCNFTKKV